MHNVFMKTVVAEFSTIGAYIIIAIALVSVMDKQITKENRKNKITLAVSNVYTPSSALSNSE
jgi:hypothetical protein